MQKEQEKLVRLSSDENDGFSSHSHLLASDSHALSQNEYRIPNNYAVDRLCLLPVNATTLHTYWEITPSLMQPLEIKSNQPLEFILKNDKNQIINQFQRQEKQGKHYIDIEPVKEKLYLEAGIYKEGEFISLLKSNEITTFNTTIIEPKQSDLKWLSKKDGYKEVIYSTMMHFSLGMSSRQYKDEIEFLEKFPNLEIEHFNSTQHIKKDKK